MGSGLLTILVPSFGYLVVKILLKFGTWSEMQPLHRGILWL